MPKFGVLGAGVVGLSSAVALQEAFPAAEVHIIAEHFYDETTSFGAAGIFRPYFKQDFGGDANMLRRMWQASWEHYDHLIHTTEASEAGVQAISGYQFTNNPLANPIERDCVYDFRALTHKELNTFPGERFKYGWFSTSIVVEPGRYLPYLLKKFRQKNGIAVKKRIGSFEELVGDYDVVVNCLGLGNQQICNDTKLYPVRGQLVKVKAPWLKHFVYTGETGECYIVPGIDVVSVGVTRSVNDYCTDVRKEDSDAIMERACRIVPSLKNAEVLYEWVGLRPTRSPQRLEKEVVEGAKGSLKVVHNYGHGGEGIGLSWGSAMQAVELVREMLGMKASL